jgi:hypothetical protein
MGRRDRGRSAQLEPPEGYWHECFAEQRFDDGGGTSASGADLDGRGMVTRPDGSRTVGLWKGGKLQRGARAD